MEVKDSLIPYKQSWSGVGPDITQAEFDGFEAVCRLLMYHILVSTTFRIVICSTYYPLSTSLSPSI